MNINHNPALRPNAQALRRNMTKEERHLWYDFLKGLPATFNRQKVMGKYIVDFYCASAKLVIELDGSQHYDYEIRVDYTAEAGVRGLRKRIDTLCRSAAVKIADAAAKDQSQEEPDEITQDAAAANEAKKPKTKKLKSAYYTPFTKESV